MKCRTTSDIFTTQDLRRAGCVLWFDSIHLSGVGDVLQKLDKSKVLGEYCGTVKTNREHEEEVGEVPDNLGYLYHDKTFDVPALPRNAADLSLRGPGVNLGLVIDGGCHGNDLAFINDYINTGRAANVKAVH